MRLHELRQAGRDVVVKNEQYGHVLVVTPEGAVYNDLDLLNMTLAFGLLFEDGWRVATNAERAELYRPKDKLMTLKWYDSPPPVPTLRLVIK